MSHFKPLTLCILTIVLASPAMGADTMGADAKRVDCTKVICDGKPSLTYPFKARENCQDLVRRHMFKDIRQIDRINKQFGFSCAPVQAGQIICYPRDGDKSTC